MDTPPPGSGDPAPPPAGGRRDPICSHPERREGVCTRCGHCEHDVILNGACFLCGTTDLDPIARSSNKPAVIPPSALVRKK